MGNLLGTSPATIYYGANSFTIPLTTRGKRYEDFIAEKITWIDLNNIIRSRIKGYRLICQYGWERIENDDLENFLSLYNYAGDVYIKFSTIYKKYQVVVTDFRRGLADGLQFYDSLEIELQGTALVGQYPNPDLMLKMGLVNGRQGIII